MGINLAFNGLRNILPKSGTFPLGHSVYNFGYISSGHCIYVSKVVRLAGYFSKLRGVRDPKRVGNTILDNINLS